MLGTARIARFSFRVSRLLVLSDDDAWNGRGGKMVANAGRLTARD
jgi:hypothetical protein